MRESVFKRRLLEEARIERGQRGCGQEKAARKFLIESYVRNVTEKANAIL